MSFLTILVLIILFLLFKLKKQVKNIYGLIKKLKRDFSGNSRRIFYKQVFRLYAELYHDFEKLKDLQLKIVKIKAELPNEIKFEIENSKKKIKDRFYGLEDISIKSRADTWEIISKKEKKMRSKYKSSPEWFDIRRSEWISATEKELHLIIDKFTTTFGDKTDLIQEIIDLFGEFYDYRKRIEAVLRIVTIKFCQYMGEEDVDFLKAFCLSVFNLRKGLEVDLDKNEVKVLIDFSEFELYYENLQHLSNNFFKRIYKKIFFSFSSIHDSYQTSFLNMLINYGKLHYSSLSNEKSFCEMASDLVSVIEDDLVYSSQNKFLTFPIDDIDFLDLYFELIEEKVSSIENFDRSFLNLLSQNNVKNKEGLEYAV